MDLLPENMPLFINYLFSSRMLSTGMDREDDPEVYEG
jgi:hypothetical protein